MKILYGKKKLKISLMIDRHLVDSCLFLLILDDLMDSHLTSTLPFNMINLFPQTTEPLKITTAAKFNVHHYVESSSLCPPTNTRNSYLTACVPGNPDGQIATFPS